ncbi:replication initiator protein A [Roseobacter sp. HKCCA0434]|uniref:replication initiator protein A n=1 Tax=Roseobacter sp. HKCCA0434 TaxID=3079297 RepID=UPI0029058210|nr:replication initiator protein A [Roseobacter sp. HKCCA0434]
MTSRVAGDEAVQLAPGGFFLCDVLGAIPKDDIATMEHPVFSLSTRPDRRVLRYAHNDVRVEITPSVKGLATIHDKDILIYCISQLVAALNAGRPVARRLTLTAHDLMVATRRETSGDGYRRLVAAFERLAGTRITTNITTGTGADAREVTEGFGLIESWRIERASRTGRMISVSVTLSEWLFRGVLSRSVLTLSRDYFALRKPLERRVYELARKHCGRQEDWRVSLEVLARKSGSASALRVFRKMIRDLVAADALPDYTLAFEADILTVRPRKLIDEDGRDTGTTQVSRAKPRAADGPVTGGPFLVPATLDAARTLMPGADVHALADDWRRHWQATGRPRLTDPDRAFLGFVRGRAARSRSGD